MGRKRVKVEAAKLFGETDRVDLGISHQVRPLIVDAIEADGIRQWNEAIEAAAQEAERSRYWSATRMYENTQAIACGIRSLRKAPKP